MTKTTGTQTLVHIPPKNKYNKSPFVLPNIQPNRLLLTSLVVNVESDTSSIASAPADETLYERILALQDMIPASTRRSIQSKVSTTSSWLKSGLFMGGKTLWVVSTSALLLGVPWALAYSEEQMIVEQERAELMAQRAQNEVCFFLQCVRSRCGHEANILRDSLWRLVHQLRDSRWARSRLCRALDGGNDQK
jgi:hypothetical protein